MLLSWSTHSPSLNIGINVVLQATYPQRRIQRSHDEHCRVLSSRRKLKGPSTSCGSTCSLSSQSLSHYRSATKNTGRGYDMFVTGSIYMYRGKTDFHQLATTHQPDTPDCITPWRHHTTMHCTHFTHLFLRVRSSKSTITSGAIICFLMAHAMQCVCSLASRGPLPLHVIILSGPPQRLTISRILPSFPPKGVISYPTKCLFNSIGGNQNEAVFLGERPGCGSSCQHCIHQLLKPVKSNGCGVWELGHVIKIEVRRNMTVIPLTQEFLCAYWPWNPSPTHQEV